MSKLEPSVHHRRFVQRLKIMREAWGMSQEKVAGLMGMKTSSYSDIEALVKTCRSRQNRAASRVLSSYDRIFVRGRKMRVKYTTRTTNRRTFLIYNREGKINHV